MNLESRILYDQDDVIAVNKPAGITTSGATLEDPECLQWHVIQRQGGSMAWAVHQLDKLTTGVNVFVTKKALVPVWQERLRHPIARKDYLAICHGDPGEAPLRLDGPIGERPDGLWGVTPRGKPALTIVERLVSNGEASLLRCRIKTGRTNQIRVHLSEAGLPLFGEGRYLPEDDAFERHALHAWRIRFATREPPWEFSAPLPEDLRALCDSLQLPTPALLDR